MIPVLLDTDIGSDIDDALCLIYLLRQARCELLGITTVTGEPERRAMLADAICRAEGRTDVPIHSGAGKPLLVEQLQKHATQAEVLPRWPHREAFEPGTAVDFMRRAIRSRPGEIALLAIGPMTNLGLLFALDPEIPSLLRSLVLMCGAFSVGQPRVPYTEWNGRVDPHATAVVYAAPANPHLSVGLDVTVRCTMDTTACRERLVGGGLDVVNDMTAVWARGGHAVCFHDPLAAAAIFDDQILRTRTGRVEVELTSPRVAGMTHWTPDPAGPHHVAADVDVGRFFTEYFSVLDR